MTPEGSKYADRWKLLLQLTEQLVLLTSVIDAAGSTVISLLERELSHASTSSADESSGGDCA